MTNYKLVLSESKIIISGLSLLLRENNIIPIVKSGVLGVTEFTYDDLRIIAHGDQLRISPFTRQQREELSYRIRQKFSAANARGAICNLLM